MEKEEWYKKLGSVHGAFENFLSVLPSPIEGKQ